MGVKLLTTSSLSQVSFLRLVLSLGMVGVLSIVLFHTVIK